MAKWVIYGKDGEAKHESVTELNGDGKAVWQDTLEYSGKWMGERFITVTVKSAYPINFQIGDYIDYRGERFTINYDPTVIKTARRGTYGEGFTYDSIKFNSPSNELTEMQMHDWVLSDNHMHYTSLPAFSAFCATVDDLVDRLQANSDRWCKSNGMEAADYWMFYTYDESRLEARVHDITEDSDTRTALLSAVRSKWSEAFKNGSARDDERSDRSVSISNQTVWEALTLVKTYFGLNFVIRGRNVYIGAAGIAADHLFEYGKGNGLYEIDKTADQDQKVVTKLHAYGSDENMPTRYYADLNMTVYATVTEVAHNVQGENNAWYSEFLTDLPYSQNLFTEALSEYGEDKYAIGITLDGIAVKARVEQGTRDTNVRIYTELVTESAADTSDNTDKTVFTSFQSALAAGKKIYFTSGITKSAFPVSNKEYGTDNLPNNMAVNTLMLPGFPTYSLAQLCKAEYDSATDTTTYYIRKGTSADYVAIHTESGKHLITFSDNRHDPYLLSPNASETGIVEGDIYCNEENDDNGLEKVYPTVEETTEADAGISSSADRIDRIIGTEYIQDNGVFPKDQDTEKIKGFTLTIPNLGFDLEQAAEDAGGSEIQISMKDGFCGGRSFSVANVKQLTNGTWQLDCKRLHDDDLDLWFPYSYAKSVQNVPSTMTDAYQIALGDHFVLTGIAVDDVNYVWTAGVKLLRKAIHWLCKNDYTRYVYTPKIDEIYMARQAKDAATAGTMSLHDALAEGDLLKFQDADLGIGGQVFIDQLNIKENGNNGIPTYDVTLRNDISPSMLQRLQSQINNINIDVSSGDNAVQTFINQYARTLAGLRDGIDDAQATADAADYLRQAFLDNTGQAQTTDVVGGLVLSTIVALRDANKKVWSGISGAYDSTKTGGGIAFWAGGGMVDKETTPTATEYAKFLVRMDGSGYASDGNISWNADGSGEVAGGKIKWDASGNLTAATFTDITATFSGSGVKVGDTLLTEDMVKNIGKIDDKVDIRWFLKLFHPLSAEGLTVEPNDYDTEIDNIRAMFGFWSEKWISALGKSDKVSYNDAYLTDSLGNYITDSDGNYITVTKLLAGGASLDEEALWALLEKDGASEMYADAQIGSEHLTEAFDELKGNLSLDDYAKKSDVETADTALSARITANGNAITALQASLKKKVDVEWFKKVFAVHDAEGNEIEPNDTDSTIADIQAQVGLWTEHYLSALGKNGTAASASGLDEAAMWEALAEADDSKQIDASHLTDALAEYSKTGDLSKYALSADLTSEASRAQAAETANANAIASLSSTLTSHTGDTSNPHKVTKAQVGLGNVENTALSTWKGTSNITTLGTITTGTWHGSKIANDYLANSSMTIAGTSVSLGGSVSASTLASSIAGNLYWANVKVSTASNAATSPTLGGLTVNGNEAISGMITSSFGSGTWINGVTNAALKGTYTNYGAILSMPTKSGRVSLSTFPASTDYVYLGYATASQISAGTNSFNQQVYWDAANNVLHLSKLMIGGVTLSEDSGTLHIDKGLYSDSFVSALGKNASTASTGMSESDMWEALGTDSTTKKIASEYLDLSGVSGTVDLTGYATQTWVTEQGYLTASAAASLLTGYVPTSRTVNGKALSANISLTASDVGASATSHTHSVKINGTTYTIAASGGTAVNLGTYLTAHQSLAHTHTLTIGNSSKSVSLNGSQSWTLSEIGAAATSHTHLYAGSSTAGGAATSATRLGVSGPQGAMCIMYGAGGKVITTSPSSSTSDYAYAGSSASHYVWSYPSGSTAVNSNNTANIMNIRVQWATTYFHDFFMSPNYGGVYHRSVINGTANAWESFITSGNIGRQSVASATKATQDGSGNTITSTYVKKAGDTITGTLVLSKTQDLSGTANNSPALIVGGTATASHIEMDANEIQAKASGTTTSILYLNNDGGNVQIGKSGVTSTLTVYGNITASGEVTASSDMRKKNVIANAGMSVDEIARSPLFRFTWKDKEQDRDMHIGTSAQYWQDICPELVHADNEGFLSLNYAGLATMMGIMLARGLRKTDSKVRKLERKVRMLEQRVAELEEKGNGHDGH